MQRRITFETVRIGRGRHDIEPHPLEITKEKCADATDEDQHPTEQVSQGIGDTISARAVPKMS